MKKYIILFVLALLLVMTGYLNDSVAALEKEISDLEVVGYALSADIEDHQPVAIAEEFSSLVGQVYFWTHIKGASEPTEIEHVWYYNDEEMARVPLPIKYPNYRTWSYKTISEEWVGDWKVEVVDEYGIVIESVSFKVAEQ